jgi:hypothetical protein
MPFMLQAGAHYDPGADTRPAVSGRRVDPATNPERDGPPLSR